MTPARHTGNVKYSLLKLQPQSTGAQQLHKCLHYSASQFNLWLQSLCTEHGVHSSDCGGVSFFAAIQDIVARIYVTFEEIGAVIKGGNGPISACETFMVRDYGRWKFKLCMVRHKQNSPQL